MKEQKHNYLRAVPLLLVFIFIIVTKTFNIEAGLLYYTILGAFLAVSIFILYKLRKEIKKKTIITMIITLVILLCVGAYYYFIVPNQ